MQWNEGGRTDTFRYVRVAWPSYKEMEDIDGVIDCKIEENMLSDLQATGALSKLGGYPFAEPREDMIRVYSTSRSAGGETETICHGTFKAHIARTTCSPQYVRTEISLYSVLKVLQDEKYGRTYALKAGGDPLNAAVTLCRNRLLPIRYGYKTGQVTLSRDVIFDPGTSMLSIVSGLVNLAGCTMTVDAYGGLVFEPYEEPSRRNVGVLFSESDYTTLVEPEYTRQIDTSEVYNRVTVVGETEDGQSLRYVAENRDKHSAWSIDRRNRTVSDYYEIVDATTQAAVEAEAKRRLTNGMSYIERETIDHLYYPYDMRMSAQLDFPSSGVAGKYGIVSRTTEMVPGMPCETVVRKYLSAETSEGV